MDTCTFHFNDTQFAVDVPGKQDQIQPFKVTVSHFGLTGRIECVLLNGESIAYQLWRANGKNPFAVVTTARQAMVDMCNCLIEAKEERDQQYRLLNSAWDKLTHVVNRGNLDD